MAPSATRYQELPRHIFGLKCSQHRKTSMRQVLKYYGKPSGIRIRKEDILQHLFYLEKDISVQEAMAVSGWLCDDNSNPGELHNQLDLIRPNIQGLGMDNISLKGALHEPLADNELPDALSQLECSVCMESITRDKFPTKKVTNSCKHEPTICASCLTTHIDTQIPEVAWNQLTCPECPELLPYNVVENWATKEVFQSYDNKAFLSAFHTVPSFVMCLGPNCGSGQIHIGGENEPIITCNKCGFKTCFIHKMPWHPDQTCKQYDNEHRQRAKQEKASERFVEKITTPCPNSECGYRIIKNGGCDHMTCQRCNHEFCWRCMASYEEIRKLGNAAHAANCTYHSWNIPAVQRQLLEDIIGVEEE